MSAAHLHIALAHVPLTGIFFGLLLVAYAMYRSNDEVFRASLIVFAIAGAVSLVVYLLGEPAEEIVEELAGISHDLIHDHEEMGLFAMIGGIALGLVSIAGLWFSRTSVPKGLRPLVLALALVAGGIMAYTANRGGQINHPEIRSADTVSGEHSHTREEHGQGHD